MSAQLKKDTKKSVYRKLDKRIKKLRQQQGIIPKCYIKFNLISTENTKLWKSSKNSLEPILTAGLSLAPKNKSGVDLCLGSSDGCEDACLYESGFAEIYETVNIARLRRTDLFNHDLKTFSELLYDDLVRLVRWAKKNGVKIYFRPNVMSDFSVEQKFPGLMEEFQTIEFYGYTKIQREMLRFLRGKAPQNYTLAWSRSEDEHNEKFGKRVLENFGGNMAVVFISEKIFPKTFWGYPTCDATSTDLWMYGKNSTVGCLKAIAHAKNDQTGFVIREI